ncbi:MAG TPA: retropepsin-like aspartic protease [Rhizomicrobium sp.]|jgi:predicted aspartyl protease
MRILLAAFLTIAFGGTVNAADCSALHIKNSIKIEPVQRYGLAMIPITLNGVEKKFLLDTGGGLNAISRETVQELKLPELTSRYRYMDLYGNASQSYVSVHDVILGSANAGGAEFQVYSNPDLAARVPFDGIYSTGRFVHDDIELDFGAERLNIFSTDHCDGRVVYWPHDAVAVAPIDMTRGHLEIQVMLDGHPLLAMLDTGATRTVLNLDRAQRKLGFSPDASAAPNSFKDDPEHNIYPRRFTSLSFEGIAIGNPVVVIRPLQFGGGKNSDNRATLGSRAERLDDQTNRLSPDMIIGMDILRHLHMYIAVDERKLYITAANTPQTGPAAQTAAPAN